MTFGQVADSPVVVDRDRLNELAEALHGFAEERAWEQFHTPKNLSMALAIEASELMDLFKWYTDDQVKDRISSKPMSDEASDELSDVIIYALCFANRSGIDVADAIKSKIEKNRSKYPADEFKGKF